MSSRNMAKDGQNTPDDSESSPNPSRKRDLNVRKTRSSTKREIKVAKVSSESEQSEEDSHSHQNSPDSGSASANDGEAGRIEVGGIKQSTRIKKKSKKMIESEMGMNASSDKDRSGRENMRQTRKSLTKRQSNKLKPKPSRTNIKPVDKRQAKSIKSSQNMQKSSSYGEDESSECEIPENLQSAFEVFHMFIIDANHDSSDEVDEPRRSYQGHENAESMPQEYYQSQFSNEREIENYLRSQNITDPDQIRELIKQIQASAYHNVDQQQEGHYLDQILRNQQMMQNLQALQFENSANNFNYALNSGNQNNQLLALVLSQALAGNAETVQRLLHAVGIAQSAQNPNSE